MSTYNVFKSVLHFALCHYPSSCLFINFYLELFRASKHVSLSPFYLPLSNTTCLCIQVSFAPPPTIPNKWELKHNVQFLIVFNCLQHIFIFICGDPPLLSKDCTVFNYKHKIIPQKTFISRLLSLQSLASTCQV